MMEEAAFPTASEGFRAVYWGTRQSDIPWHWNDDGFGQMCFIREDEDFEVFGIRAGALTYTFRNSIFYGVRIDFEGVDQSNDAEQALLGLYPPIASIRDCGKGERFWQTAQTSVWLTRASADSGGILFLWGRHRMFADDADRPIYHALPPALNSHPGRYQPRVYVCYRTSGPIAIDGRLDEKAWRDAPWSQMFEDHQAPYAPEPWKTTRFKMLYDDTYLYFGAELQEENVWGALTEHDCVIYYDNDFEIFLNPTADGVGYYEFEINPLNTAWDMFHETDYHRASALHTLYNVTGLRHAVDVQGTLNYHHDEDTGWTVEVRWPLASLRERNLRVKLPIEHGDMWRLNFSRVQYMHIYNRLVPAMVPKSPCEDWIWQSTGTGDLHNPEMWGKVRFSELTAGTVVDRNLETGIPLLPAPATPASREVDSEEMIFLQACSLVIGPDPTDGARSPAHEVDVDAFWIDPCPVTVSQYTRFLNTGGQDGYYDTWMRIPEHCGIRRVAPGQYEYEPGRALFPVVYVSYDGARAYAAHYNKMLPSEVQWERAARGSEGRLYAWGNAPINPTYANYDFHYGGTTAVGSFPRGATPDGVFDMTGNVKEYTTSLFEPYPGGEPMIYLGMREPFIYENITKCQVMRGGAWTKQEACMAAAYRDAHGSLNLGFRCVRSA